MPRAARDPVTGLTHKQEKFSLLYVTGPDNVAGNATACYRQAFSCATAKDETIQRKACELLKKDKIRGRIAALRATVAEKAEIDSSATLRETGLIARSDIRRLFNDNGTLKDPKDWPDDIARAVASVEVFEEFQGQGKNRKLVGYTKKVRFWDKNAALERLFKHFGLYEKDNRQKADPVVELLKAIDGRAKFIPPGLDSTTVAGRMN